MDEEQLKKSIREMKKIKNDKELELLQTEDDMEDINVETEDFQSQVTSAYTLIQQLQHEKNKLMEEINDLNSEIHDDDENLTSTTSTTN